MKTIMLFLMFSFAGLCLIIYSMLNPPDYNVIQPQPKAIYTIRDTNGQIMATVYTVPMEVKVKK